MFLEPRTISPAAERAEAHLRRVLTHLRCARLDADAAHDVMEARDLAPDTSGCVPDELSDLIATVEKFIHAVGGDVPRDTGRA